MVVRVGQGALLVACMWAVAACGGGSGGPIVTTTGQGTEQPAPVRDQPPGTRDPPGNACIVCDVNYVCTGGMTIDLSSSSGYCTAASIDLVCSGALFDAAACSGGGGGAFTCGTVTCEPQVNQPLPGGATGFGVDGG